MKEIILCRLGGCFAPHWIQMRWFEHNNIKNIITLEKECQHISYKEWEKYKSNPNHRLFVNNRDSYLHYEKVDKPNPFKTDYEYTNEQGYNFISKNEKDLFYLNDEKLERDFENCFERRLDIAYEDGVRTNKFLIKLVKEFQKTFPDGDDLSHYGKWCYNVVSIPDDVEYEIDEPEGCNECIREVHRVWLFNGEQIGKEVRK